MNLVQKQFITSEKVYMTSARLNHPTKRIDYGTLAF